MDERQLRVAAAAQTAAAVTSPVVALRLPASSSSGSRAGSAPVLRQVVPARSTHGSTP